MATIVAERQFLSIGLRQFVAARAPRHRVPGQVRSPAGKQKPRSCARKSGVEKNTQKLTCAGGTTTATAHPARPKQSWKAPEWCQTECKFVCWGWQYETTVVSVNTCGPTNISVCIRGSHGLSKVPPTLFQAITNIEYAVPVAVPQYSKGRSPRQVRILEVHQWHG